MRLVAGLRPDQPGKLTALPQTPSWIKEGGELERGRGALELGKGREVGGTRRKWEDPQYPKCIDANTRADLCNNPW